MSKIGQLIRGLKWYNYRNLDGVLNPDVAEDPNKMIEVNAYLDFVEGKDADKIHKIFERYRLIDLANPRHKEGKMDAVAAELESVGKPEKKEAKKEEKKEEK